MPARASNERRIYELLRNMYGDRTFLDEVIREAGNLQHFLSTFLSRVSTLTRDIDIAILSVRLSVRDVPVLDENGLTYCHIFSSYGSPIILVVSESNIFTKFELGHPPAGALNTGGYKNFAIFC